MLGSLTAFESCLSEEVAAQMSQLYSSFMLNCWGSEDQSWTPVAHVCLPLSRILAPSPLHFCHFYMGDRQSLGTEWGPQALAVSVCLLLTRKGGWYPAEPSPMCMLGMQSWAGDRGACRRPGGGGGAGGGRLHPTHILGLLVCPATAGHLSLDR